MVRIARMEKSLDSDSESLKDRSLFFLMIEKNFFSTSLCVHTYMFFSCVLFKGGAAPLAMR